MATDKPFTATLPRSNVANLKRASLRQLWQVPAFILGILLVLGVWVTRPLLSNPEARLVQRALLKARSVLDDPRAPANEVPAYLTEALKHIDRFPAQAGEVHFLLGYAYARLAGPLNDEHNGEIWRRAREQLELADQLGVPEGDHFLLLYL